MKTCKPRPAYDRRKQSVYFPEQLLRQVLEEAARLDRSASWVMQKAWRLSYKCIADLPDA